MSPAMEKIDLKKVLKALYQPCAKAVSEIDVPPMNFLMVDGEGDPNTAPAYAEAIEALFAASYTIKFRVRKERQIDYGVLPLEGLWWADDPEAFKSQDKSAWKWTMMIAQPDFVSEDEIGAALAELRVKKALPALAKLRLAAFHEGRCAQILHIGPFATEASTLARLHEHIGKHGSARGRHHEIYLSDIRRADPAKWKTVIRQPLA